MYVHIAAVQDGTEGELLQALTQNDLSKVETISNLGTLNSVTPIIRQKVNGLIL